MATDDQQVLVTGTASAPTHFTIPGNGQIQPKTIFANFNGSGAAGSFVPTLKIVSDGGETVGIYPLATSIAAGGSANVSWFPLGARGAGTSNQTLIGAKIQATQTQSIANDTNTDLVYQSVAFDTDGMANLGANSRILTINTDGLYLVTCATLWPYQSTGRRINGITANAYFASGGTLLCVDSRMPIWDPFGSSIAPHSGNLTVGTMQLSAGDFIASGVFQDSGAALNCNGQASTVGASGSNAYLSAVMVGI